MNTVHPAVSKRVVNSCFQQDLVLLEAADSTYPREESRRGRERRLSKQKKWIENILKRKHEAVLRKRKRKEDEKMGRWETDTLQS